MNLVDVFVRTAEKQPEHPAVIGPGDNDMLTYQQLREKIEAVAEQLKAAGIQAGDCVGLHYPSGREYMILVYAAWRCGACVVPIAVELVTEEKLKICEEIRITSVVSKASTIGIVEKFRTGPPVPLYDDIVVVPVASQREHPQAFASVNAAFLRFTSGTTGNSKGVVLSHETIYDRIHAANEVLEIGPADRIVWLMSMSYHFAVSIAAYLSFGATILLCRNHLGATIIQTTAKHGGTFIYGSPLHYELMAQDRSSLRLEGVRLAIATAAAMRSDIADAFYDRFQIALTEAYGIIEVGLPCINLSAPAAKRGSVGRLLPAYQLRMDDVGLGDDLKAIHLRGKGLLDAYYDPWQAREDILADGWFATGDLGKLDEEGYIYILGRSKDMINVGGMKFFPQEAEAVLKAHPAVADACVYAHRHKRFGDIPYAQVVLRPDAAIPTAKELVDYCVQHLAPFKIPQKIDFVEALTMTASGKLIRQEAKIAPRKEPSHVA